MNASALNAGRLRFLMIQLVTGFEQFMTVLLKTVPGGNMIQLSNIEEEPK